VGSHAQQKRRLYIFKLQGLYSQHFIFTVTYEWAKETRMIHYIWLEGVAKDKDSSLLGPLVSYEENEVL
jgi:hypothetical protein